MAEDLTIYVKEGTIGPGQEKPKTPPKHKKTFSEQSTLKQAKIIASAIGLKQTYTTAVQQIGFATGDYELQEMIETGSKIVGIGFAALVAPAPVAVTLAIKTGFDVWATGVRQNRAIYQQQQNQILTGKISVNGGRY